MQETEENGHHRRVRSICQDQTARLKREKDREEEEDDSQNGKPESVLQRVICFCCGRNVAQ